MLAITKGEVELQYITDLLQPNKDENIVAVPSAELSKIPYEDLRTWCHYRGVYGIPTVELLDFLKDILATDDTRMGSVIEVGAGNGCFGRLLGIPATDSLIQLDPDVAAWYARTQQPTVNYGSNVLEFEASEAIDIFKPDIVFGSWVTQYIAPDDFSDPGTGSVYGLKEEEFMPKLKKYVVYGNDAVHGRTRLFNSPKVKVTQHRNIDHFWSRAGDHGRNALYVVENIE